MFVCYAQFHNSRVTPYFCADVFASERAVVCKRLVKNAVENNATLRPVAYARNFLQNKTPLTCLHGAFFNFGRELQRNVTLAVCRRACVVFTVWRPTVVFKKSLFLHIYCANGL